MKSRMLYGRLLMFGCATNYKALLRDKAKLGRKSSSGGSRCRAVALNHSLGMGTSGIGHGLNQISYSLTGDQIQYKPQSTISPLTNSNPTSTSPRKRNLIFVPPPPIP